jgi:hypothetical protein
LMKRQRKVGNTWLARELGYKTEEDHLKDCVDLAQKKQHQVIKDEHDRLKSNERKQLRERLLLQEHGLAAEDDDEENELEIDAPAAEEDEEDEELELAKEIEREQQTKEKATSPTTETEATTQDESTEDSSNSDMVQTNKPKALVSRVVTDEGPAQEPVDNDEDYNDDFGMADGQTEDETPGFETQPLFVHSKVDTESSTEVQEQDKSQGFETQPPIIVLPQDEIQRVVSEEESQGTSNSEISSAKEIEDISQDASRVDGAQHDKVVSDASKPADSETATTDDALEDDKEKQELAEEDESPQKEQKKPRNAGWQAMLARDAEKHQKMKKRKGGGGLVEEEADEEEEEEVAGLEDFGFSVNKKEKGEDDEEDAADDKLDEDDLEHVVDELSDDEGDEEAGDAARKRLEQKEEKDKHKEILRRMREGYDGRRGGIAGGGMGARGNLRFDQLVAADNREDAKRLGLLNDDELDSDEEGNGKAKGDDEEEDESALLDKMLKDRFMHRSNVEIEEKFSDDEEEEKEIEKGKDLLDGKFMLV